MGRDAVRQRPGARECYSHLCIGKTGGFARSLDLRCLTSTAAPLMRVRNRYIEPPMGGRGPIVVARHPILNRTRTYERRGRGLGGGRIHSIGETQRASIRRRVTRPIAGAWGEARPSEGPAPNCQPLPREELSRPPRCLRSASPPICRAYRGLGRHHLSLREAERSRSAGDVRHTSWPPNHDDSATNRRVRFEGVAVLAC